MHRLHLALALVGCASLSPAARAQGCGNSTGNTPLTDLGTGTYLGYQGGLYPGGANVPPPAHLAAALALAAQIRPLDASGQHDPGCGLIGMISIGMSNTTHEFAVFERQEDASSARNPRVAIVTCSQGGMAAEAMDDPTDMYWDLVDLRVAAAGLSHAQVQVAWLKQALGQESLTVPGDALTLQAALGDIARILHDTFPNLKLCYLSSRIYGGYSAAHPEPVTYESGFAFKWLIEEQINGAPMLNWNASLGPVEAPLCLWGPYLWADGEVARSDGLLWCPADLENDGTHPSPAGEQKVADLLSDFFANDATAQPWFANPGLEPLATFPAVADASVVSSQPNTNFGSDPTLFVQTQSLIARAYLRFDVSSVERPVVHAKLSLRVPTNPLGIGAISARLVPDTSWSEGGITFANAPGPSGA